MSLCTIRLHDVRPHFRRTRFAPNTSSPAFVATRSTFPHSRPSSPLFAPCGSHKLVVTCSIRCAWPSQAGHQFRSHLWLGRTFNVQRNYQSFISCHSSISFCFRPPTLCLFQNAFLYYGPFTISDTAPPTPASSTHTSLRTSLRFSKHCPHFGHRTSFALIVYRPTLALLTTM